MCCMKSLKADASLIKKGVYLLVSSAIGKCYITPQMFLLAGKDRKLLFLQQDLCFSYNKFYGSHAKLTRLRLTFCM